MMKDRKHKTTKRIIKAVALGSVIAGYGDHEQNKKENRETKSLYEDCIKRGLDFACASAALIVFSPLYLTTAALVKLKLGSPVLFTQDRPGRDEKIFKLYKFRTMTDERDAEGNLLPDEERLTPFGKFLRSTSMDELPEAINILKGDMSVIGPRPWLIRYLPYFRPEEHHRHDVRPGLTGWAQINGRNNVDWDERIGMDLHYVKNVSFPLDVEIIAKSFVKMIRREDIASGNELTLKDLDEERSNDRN